MLSCTSRLPNVHQLAFDRCCRAPAAFRTYFGWFSDKCCRESTSSVSQVRFECTSKKSLTAMLKSVHGSRVSKRSQLSRRACAVPTGNCLCIRHKRMSETLRRQDQGASRASCACCARCASVEPGSPQENSSNTWHTHGPLDSGCAVRGEAPRMSRLFQICTTKHFQHWADKRPTWKRLCTARRGISHVQPDPALTQPKLLQHRKYK